MSNAAHAAVPAPKLATRAGHCAWAAFAILAAAACRTVGRQDSTTKLVNGQGIESAPSEVQAIASAVVQITTPTGASCTATFLDPYTVLSAAHCVVEGDGLTPGRITLAGETSSQVFTPPDYQSGAWNQDIALARFSKDIGESAFRVSTYSPYARWSITGVFPGAEIIAIGFGRDQDGYSGFRWGKNSIDTVDASVIQSRGVATGSEDGNDVIINHGDSGGPLLNRDLKIIGVAVAFQAPANGQQARSFHVRLTSTAARRIFADAGIDWSSGHVPIESVAP